MKLFHDYSLSDNGTFSATSTASGYNVANLQYNTLGKKWKSASTTSVTVTVDTGTTESVGAIALLGVNFLKASTLTVNVLIQAADDAAFTVGVVTVYQETPTVLEQDNFIYFFTPIVKRYFRIQIQPSVAMQVEMGRFVLGPAYTPTTAFSPAYALGPGRTQTKTLRTRGGQLYSSRGETLKVFNGQIPELDLGDFDEITLLQNTNSTGTPFIISFDTGVGLPYLASDQYSLYGTLDRVTPLRNVAVTEWLWNLSMTEQK